MKKIVLISLLVVSSLYASSDKETREAILNTAITQVSTMCSSKAYTECYKLSQNECIKALEPIIKSCYKQYESSIFANSNKSHLSLVGNKIGQCAGNKYHAKFQNRADKKCLESVNISLR